MRNRTVVRRWQRVVATALLAGIALLAQPVGARAPRGSSGQAAQPAPRTPDVIFVSTPDTVIQAMLDVAGVTAAMSCTTSGAATGES